MNFIRCDLYLNKLKTLKITEAHAVSPMSIKAVTAGRESVTWHPLINEGVSAPVVPFLAIRTLCSHFSMGVKSFCALNSNADEPGSKAGVHLQISTTFGEGPPFMPY